jgi:predicted translin family RNA/ssDNA-binding protein
MPALISAPGTSDARPFLREAANLLGSRANSSNPITDTTRGLRIGFAAKILVDIQKAPAFRHAGFVQQALGEYVEAILLANPRNATSKLAKIPGDALVLGVADAIGELRRVVLTHLLADDVKTARQALDQMERLFAALTDVEAPEPLVPVRAKRDQARGILERTRSDLVTAKKSKDLETKIDRLGDLLDEAEGRPKKKSKKPNADDLDLDGAWSRS